MLKKLEETVCQMEVNRCVITTTYKCQQNKCYPRKHLKSGKRDEKNNKLIEKKNVNRMIKKDISFCRLFFRNQGNRH
jgi:hypothetical protein